MSEQMQLAAEDYRDLATWGPTGITDLQFEQMVKAARYIKTTAFKAGHTARSEEMRAYKEATNAE